MISTPLTIKYLTSNPFRYNPLLTVPVAEVELAIQEYEADQVRAFEGSVSEWSRATKEATGEML